MYISIKTCIHQSLLAEKLMCLYRFRFGQMLNEGLFRLLINLFLCVHVSIFVKTYKNGGYNCVVVQMMHTSLEKFIIR